MRQFSRQRFLTKRLECLVIGELQVVEIGVLGSGESVGGAERAWWWGDRAGLNNLRLGVFVL